MVSTSFSDNFYILKSPTREDELIWGTGEKAIGGEFQIWLVNETIALVRPAWKMRIDGKEYEQKMHADLRIPWHELELSWRDYSFQCIH